ncbi:CAP domain-containing protein [Galbibacter sp. BG1]|uniref:CAP domain-containing protein n=1 Tax=Galbibacter sp. BG1 TaxID=1170699 RepID=UPI0015B9D783|nr:CAP domain-containing protein [Galbibacter sp. BG1]QLE02235.1 CAP domain-containing protein [Galbibacter sp. BG1]
MNAIVKTIALALLFCSFSSFYACSAEENQEKIYVEKPASQYVLEDEVLELINEYRISQNLNALEKFELATLEANRHNGHMIEMNEVCHHFFGNRERELKNNNAIAVGENVAYGFYTAEGVVKAWLESPSHKKNIEGDFTASGISASNDEDGNLYYTHIFVKK